MSVIKEQRHNRRLDIDVSARVAHRFIHRFLTPIVIGLEHADKFVECLARCGYRDERIFIKSYTKPRVDYPEKSEMFQLRSVRHLHSRFTIFEG